MSPNGTRLMGDLEKLPGCAPAGLHGLHAMAEGVIQRQIRLLGSGTPSKAPDLRELLRNEGIAKPEDQSTMLDKYSEYKDEVDKVKTGIQGKDDGIVVRTAGIGGVVKKAYDDIDTSVGEVNELITASHKAVQPVTDDKGNPVLDKNGNRTYFLPKHIVDGLFEGIWKTLNTTLDEVQGVSDKAATEALKITNEQPSYPTTHGNGGPPVTYSHGGFNGASFGGSTNSGSSDVSYMGPASEADYSQYPGNMTVDQAIEGALDALGITDPEARENWIRGYRVLIERESGGNPNIRNDWDSNAASGQNSRGLTQTIPSTFEAYHQPGTSKNIYDPVANVAASMNYVMERYNVARDGSNLQQNVQQADPNRPAKGY